MKHVLPILFLASFAFGVPEPVVTGSDSYNGYATVSGKLNAKPAQPVGISVLNGNTLSSTVTDPSGRWSIVFRHQSVQYSVTSWDLSSKTDRSNSVTGHLKIED